MRRKKLGLERKEQFAQPSFQRKVKFPELITDEELQKYRESLILSEYETEQIALPQITTGKRAKKTFMARFRERIRMFMQLLLRWLSNQKTRRLTRKGEIALRQLKELSSLYAATSLLEGMDEVLFHSEFGTAYYNILSESKRKLEQNETDAEDYAHHIGRFASVVDNLL